MNDNQHIPSGYKPSPLGIIPEDWEVKRLGDFSTFFSGGTPRSGNPSFYSGEIPFIRSGEIGNDKTELFLSKEGLESSSAKLVEKGDLLYALYGANSGQCAISKINGAINQAILCIRPNSDRYYILSVLQLNKDYYYNAYLQGGQGNLSAEIVSNYRIKLPSIEEQKQICQLLSLWDTAIAKQTALIEQLTLRKRGLMQQLLTGKKRLKGFEGSSFKMMSFDKIANTINVKAFQISKSDYQEKGKTPIVDQGQMFIAAYSDSDKIFTNVPFILFGDHTRIIKWIDFPCIIGADGVQAIKPKEEIDIKYLYYLLSNTELPNLGYSRHMSILKEKVFYVSTDIDEQKAIAECLSNADKEIEIQKQKLAAMQEQKKGLMQVLLTGKRRIV